MLSDFKPASALWEAFSPLAHKITSCFGNKPLLLNLSAERSPALLFEWAQFET